jgi:cysteine desulfurase / selenocysteine lyase
MSTTTRTSDLAGADLPADLRQLESLSAIAAGLPDPAVLAQLANEMFKDLPASADFGALASPRVPVDADPQLLNLAPPTVTIPAIPSKTSSSLAPPSLESIVTPAIITPAMPGLSSSGALAQAAAPAAAIPVPGATIPTPGIPGGFSAENYATLPSFSFLDEARSIYASPPAAPVHAMPATTVSTEKIAAESAATHTPTSRGSALTPAVRTPLPSMDSASALSPMGATLPGLGSSGALLQAAGPAAEIPVPGLTIPTPGIPGGFSPANYATVPSFSFLDDARSIYASPPAAPVHAMPMPTDSPGKFPERYIGGSSQPQMPSSLGGIAPPLIPVDVPGVSTPQTLGATTKPLGFDPGISFNFLEEIKPLEPINAVPTLMPAGADLPQPQSGSFAAAPFDVQAIRRDFPILQERVNGRPLIWLDNAATTQKPQAVIDRLSYFYSHENSNVHRAAHTLAARATDAYENARKTTARFLSAPGPENIIFVRGATEAINLVAQSWGRRNVQKDDEIVITWLEHHANIVPWQMLCSEKGARLRVAPVDSTGQVILEEYEKLLNPRTKIVSIAQVSNALGTIVPVTQMTEMAHRHGARVLVDGAQAVSHMPVDVQIIDCDFYVFSGHKVFAPTGIGVVYGKQEILENTPPWQGGGNMIADVTFEKTVYQPPPLRFEAGTGNIADAVSLGAALDYVQRIGMHNIARYEHHLLVYGTESLGRIPGLHLIGTAREKASVMSFVLDGFDTEDVGQALAQQGIAVRAGHHCAQPILRRFGVERTVRPSLAFYNTCEEIDTLVAAIWNLKSGRHPGLR